MKYGRDVVVGDDIIFLGTPHRITRIEPYTHPVVTGGETWATAYADTSAAAYQAAWGITLEPDQQYETGPRHELAAPAAR